MPRPGCPVWHYESHPQFLLSFPSRITALIADIYSARYSASVICADTRSIHGSLFAGLTLPKHPYYAGHYRGETGCLIGYEIHIGAPTELERDPLVGRPSNLVPHEMARYGKQMVKWLNQLDEFKKGAILMDPVIRMAVIAKFACDAFVTLLTIHPYADGNGHTARALLWLVLFHFGYAAPEFTIDPRPPFPDYSAMIAAHRRGNVEMLETFLISTLAIVDNSKVNLSR